MSESGSDDGQLDEDERISSLVTYMGKHSAEETANHLKTELGGKDGMVYGGMCFNASLAMAHFLVTACFDEDSTLTSQIDENKELLAACCKDDEEFQAGFLLAMELYIVRELRKGISKYDKVLKKLWECDVVSEDLVEKWHGKENALHEFYPEFVLDDAIAIRESAGKFLEWVQDGDD
uniref:W2 domain-containing protein n=1 Tax=Hemiselmis tepida TaxID=464990 RepID=A0A7S0YW28_9CRYP|mmetsp:Transcript_26292/g.66864  ORF Transcript_26292/g.66864 Transcript_26292/m.66864 type:complete len:178 (+) Transcript_26292:24-557(+)